MDWSDEIIFSVAESLEGGYEAKALSFPIFTEAGPLEELRSMIRDVVDCHYEVQQRPRMICLHFVRDELIAL